MKGCRCKGDNPNCPWCDGSNRPEIRTAAAPSDAPSYTPTTTDKEPLAQD